MVDAVNAAISSVSTLPAASREAAVVASSILAADSSSVVSMPQAPYVSPYIHVDLNFDTAVLQIRDSDTGDVVEQFPSESRLQQLRRAQQLVSRAHELSGGGESSEQVKVEQKKYQDIEFSRSGSLDTSTLVAAQSSAPSSPASGPALPQAAISALSSGVQQSAPAAQGTSQLV
ncbi:MAG: hypothetical protein OEY94_02640 [Alphaproteobacteria bacterium]|nr:hypothetical protein [Alphaproteobacteria bacterium]